MFSRTDCASARSRRIGNRGEQAAASRHRIDNSDCAAALAAGQAEARAKARAQAVRYVPDRDAIEIVTTRNAGFLIARSWIAALRGVPTAELHNLTVWPDGSAAVRRWLSGVPQRRPRHRFRLP